VRVGLVMRTLHKAKEFVQILFVALWNVVHYDTHDEEHAA
jgi:hypothetical protein